MKKTPLYENHIRLGGKIIEFGQWLLPVQYTGILEEHEQVRKAAGLFDVSHMGEILVTGPDAATFIAKTDFKRYRTRERLADRLLTNVLSYGGHCR